MYGGTYGDLNTKLLLAAESDRTQENVSRGEYRFLLMEYTRMGLELAEMKKAAAGYEWELYQALKNWYTYEPMTDEQSERFDQLKEKFEPKVAEGSLAE